MSVRVIKVNEGGYSGYSGFSGFVGTSGYSAYSGYSGFCGLSGYSGFSGAGASGYSGFSGRSGYSGFSGYSGYSGQSGYSGFCGSGVSGYSGFSGTAASASGYSGFSGRSGYSGFSGFSGRSGFSGQAGPTGATGTSGFSGYSSTSGYSGFSSTSGYSGFSGANPGASGYSGYCGLSGYSGYSGGGGSAFGGNIQAYRELGSVIFAETVGMTLVTAHSNSALVDQRCCFVAIYLPTAQTLTGVKWLQSIQGSYTADNNNRIGLYSYSGGTLTLQASCANDGNLWKAASGAVTNKAFSSTFAASAGIYFVGFLYNNSSQTTAPSLGTLEDTIITASNAGDFTNSAAIMAFLAAQTDLPASQAMSGLTASSQALFWMALY